MEVQGTFTVSGSDTVSDGRNWCETLPRLHKRGRAAQQKNPTCRWRNMHGISDACVALLKNAAALWTAAYSRHRVNMQPRIPAFATAQPTHRCNELRTRDRESLMISPLNAVPVIRGTCLFFVCFRTVWLLGDAPTVPSACTAQVTRLRWQRVASHAASFVNVAAARLGDPLFRLPAGLTMYPLKKNARVPGRRSAGFREQRPD